MITATIEERKVVKGITTLKREIRVYTSMDKARKELKPIAQEMARCEQLKIKPKILIDGVSYDTDSEKRLLREIGAYKHEKTIEDAKEDGD